MTKRSEADVMRTLRELYKEFSLPLISEYNDDFKGIPPGTLWWMLEHDMVPKKWRKKLNITMKGTYPPRLAISKVDMESAARSIINNLSRTDIRKLVRHLTSHLWEGNDQ